MQTRLSRICDAIIESGWLTALVVTPLFFNTYTNRVFEPDKIHLLRSIALVMAVAWIVQLLDGGWRGTSFSEGETERDSSGLWIRIRRTPLVLPALVLVAAYLISTTLSVVPRISFFGSYVRMQGTYTFLSYTAIFAMVLTHIRSRAQINRLIYTVILTSLPISIYGIIQRVGSDPLPWAGDVTQRVAANMGNAIFVAAYLIMAVFLTLERLVDSTVALMSTEEGSTADALRAGGYLFVLAVQLIAIVLTQSRGPIIGLGAGLYVFGMLGIRLLGRWVAGRPRAPRWLGRAMLPLWLFLIGLSVAVAAFLIVFNLPNGPLASWRSKPYIGRMATVLNTKEGTNAVRVLIWQGVVDMMLKPHAPIEYPDGSPDRLNLIRPLVGYGPESMWVAYNRFYPPDLAHYEARNASPDRSHNETFDALVRTGFLGLGAQLFLYGSIFYFALRWLGLMQGRRRRNLFLGLLIGGAALGVVLPLLLDHSLRLAGIALPAGLILGLIAYVTIDLLLTPTAQVTETGAGTDVDVRYGRRQLLILAIFSAIVAHFVEVHFGIAIVSTLTLFWTLSALLVVVGMGWIELAEESIAATIALAVEPQPSAPPASVVAAEAASSLSKGRASSSRSQPPGGSKGRKTSTKPDKRAAGSGRQTSIQVGQRRDMPEPSFSLLRQFLPYAGISGTVTLVLTWNFLVNQAGAQSALAVLWDAFTVRVDKVSSEIIRSPVLLMLMVFTWVVGGLLAWAEASHQLPTWSQFRQQAAGRGAQWDGSTARPPSSSQPTGREAGLNILIYLGSTVGVFLIYGTIQASRLGVAGLQGLDAFRHFASHIAVFDLILLLVLLGVAAEIWLSDMRPHPVRAFGAHPLNGPVVSLAGGIVAGSVALLIIININIRTIQADTYYKQGLAFEGEGAWDSAIILYREATRLEPKEDFYDLFLGRALLTYATSASAGGSPILPADLSAVKTGDLLSLVDMALQVGNREDLLRATQAALVAAQRLNPLNTDHSANLARLNRTWAFANAVGPNDVPSEISSRELVTTRPNDVSMPHLEQALRYYEQATSLSPQNAQLWNELASVQFIKGDTEAALKTLDHSSNLDPKYQQTRLLRGDFLAAAGDQQAALDAYRQAAAANPSDVNILSAIGVFSAQSGDTNGALDAFKRIIDLQSKGLASAEGQLAELDAQATSAGGYTLLPPAATSRRDALQGRITAYRSQLQLIYRNTALVLRDAGRTAEALQAAQTALSLASESERPTIEALIAELQSRSSK